MKAAELLVRCLENEDVDYIFGIPGEENVDMMDVLLDSKIRFITTRHEQGAAFMADVYGRLTGRAGVCLSTLGPGATNLVTGVADANMDRAPVVAIAGQAATTRMHKESHQHLDLVSLFAPITKYSTQIREPARRSRALIRPPKGGQRCQHSHRRATRMHGMALRHRARASWPRQHGSTSTRTEQRGRDRSRDIRAAWRARQGCTTWLLSAPCGQRTHSELRQLAHCRVTLWQAS